MANKAAEYIKELKAESEKLSASELQAKIEELTQKRIAEIRNTKTEVTVKGTSYYVSNDGNDENDGKSPEKRGRQLQR